MAIEVSELRYLVYRCSGCRRVLTSLEMQDKWGKSQADGHNDNSLCPCGANKVAPSNPTLFEELTLPRIWKLWFKKVFLPRFKK